MVYYFCSAPFATMFSPCRPLILLAFSIGAASALDCSIATINAALPDNANTVFAVRVAANGTFGQGPVDDIGYPSNATNLPSLCSVLVNVTSSSSSAYTFGLFLPDNWNERFLTVGNGGFSGGVNWPAMGYGVSYGFSTMSTNTGHNSNGTTMTWGLNSPEKVKDWGYRAMHGSVDLAKKVTKAYYAEAAKYSYYSGCSTGGRQGLKEAQEYPDDFDGILTGAPSWWTNLQEPWHLRTALANLPVTGPQYIPDALFDVISDEVLRQCDSSDGVVDGVVMDYKKCNFYPEALLCAGNSTNTSSCLTSPQLDTLYKLYEPIIDVNQTWIYPSFNLGTEKQMVASMAIANNEPGADPLNFIKDLVLNDPSWDWHNFDYSVLQEAQLVNPGTAQADNFNLAPFHNSGGKLLIYHGLADGQIPVEASNYYYDHVKRNLTINNPGINIDDFYRYFHVPGLQHCSGGIYNSAWYVAGPSQQSVLGPSTFSVPGFRDADHDALMALMAWVEEGKPVERIIATKFKNETVSMGVQSQRPICPYPSRTTYDGYGAVDNPDSWFCQSHI
jgi:feruloyl esterase